MAEEVQKREYKAFDMSAVVIGTAGTGDFADYEILETEEPYPAFVQDIKLGSKFNRTKQIEEDRVFVWCEITDGPGKGQRYRADFPAKISPETNTKKTALTQFLEKVYPNQYTSMIDDKDLIGRPIRIELGAPWKKPNDTSDSPGMQFIETFKKATADQKKVTVEKQEDVAPNDVMAEITGDALDALFD